MAWNSSNRRERLPADWPRRTRWVLARDGRVCQLLRTGCETAATEVDHIEPGDNHELDNLQAACGSCHAQKSTAEGNARRAELRARRRRPPKRHPGSRSTP